MSRVAQAWLWANATDARTWTLHTLVAVVLAFAWSPTVAVAFYLVREVEQIVNEFAVRKAARRDGLPESPSDWLDHFMDVAAPAAAVGLLILAGLEW